MNRIHGTILDRMELPFLVGLQDHMNVMSRVRRQTDQGVQAIMAANGSVNGTMPTATVPGASANTATATEDDQGIINRSPTINYYLGQEVGGHQLQPPVVGSPQGGSHLWWIPSLLVASMVGLVVLWWIYTHPVQSAPVPVATGAGASSTYLEIR